MKAVTSPAQIAVTVTLVGVMADLAYFTAEMAAWFLFDQQLLPAAVYAVMAAAFGFLVGSVGWGSIKIALASPRSSRG